jgi:PKD repeat protein
VYNFGLITVRDNAYDGTEACFQQVIDAFGFQTQPESQPPYMTDPCFGDFLSPVTVANQQVYGLRPPPTGAPTPPRSGSSDAVVNGSFEDGDAAWRLGHTAGFAVETSAAYDGSASLTLRDAHTATYYPLASQVIPNLLPGTYHLRAWVKTAALGTETASNSGIRLALKDNSMTRGNGHIAASQLFRLTQDWTLVDVLAQLTTSGDYTIKIEAYRKPNGTAWIDVISLEGPFNEAPIADIAADPIMGEAPLAVVYDGSSSLDPDGTISAYDWDFGDGASDSGEIVSHTFTRSGTYSTVLTVTDNAGETDAIEVVVIVAVGPQTELILNSGFEDVDALGWPLDWYLGATGAWQIEARDALDGLRSLYLSGADLESRAPIASAATVTLTPGRYIFGAWIETAALGVEPSRTRGIRLSLKDESSTQGSGNIASTPIIRGTTPMLWVSAEAEIAETGNYTLQIQTYNHPAGEAWIEGVSLMRVIE